MTRPAPVGRSLLSALFFLAVLSFALAGCGDSKEQKGADSQKKEAADAKSSGKSGDQAQQAAPPPPEIKVVAVKSVNAPLVKDYSASIAAKESVEIKARVAGYLQKWHFTEGAIVNKGDPLFSIEPSEYQEALNEAKSQLARDQATLSKAQTDVQRFGELYKKGAISREEYDNRVTAFKEYQATVEQDKAAVKQAELNLSYTDIKSPVTGRIGRAQAQVGDLVGHGDNTLLATITTVDPMYVNFSISEQDYLSYVKEAHEREKQHKKAPDVDLLLKLSDGSIYEHHGKINMVDPTVDQKTGTLGVRATFPNPDDILRPGQFARVILAIQRDDKVILMPQRAVQEIQGMKMCLTTDKDGKVSSTPITLGQQLESFVEVEKGLKEGDLVLVEGLQKIRAGDVIKPQVTQLDLESLKKAYGGEGDSQDDKGQGQDGMPDVGDGAQADTSDDTAAAQSGAQQ